MSRQVRLIQGKGDWNADPPTGASDADLYHIVNDFVASAGVVNLEGGDALVTETAPTGFKVKIAKGTIYVPNSSWIPNSNEPRYYQVVGDADEEVTVATNPSGSTRVDLVCQKIDKVTAPNDLATNVSPIVIVQGTPGAGAPSLPANHELLATLTLPDGYTAVVNSMIADGRRQVYIDSKEENDGWVDLVDGATITLNRSLSKKWKFRVTLDGHRTLALSGFKIGQRALVRFTNDETARNITFPALVKWIGIEDDPVTSDYADALKVHEWGFICTDAATQAFDGYFIGAEE